MNITPSMNCTRFFRQVEIISCRSATLQSAGLFANDVLARCRRTPDPFLAQAGRQRKVNRIHVFGSDQFLVTVQRHRRIFKRGFGLTFRDKLAAAFEVAAGHGGYYRIAAVKNRRPVFPGNARRA
jgi:hypothetical protein